MRVVAVDAPRRENPLGEAVLTGAADVVHDGVRPFLGDGCADPAGDVIEGGVPVDLLPAALAALADAAQRVEDPVRVGDLVDRRRALGTVASPRTRVLGVALELAHLEGFSVDIGEQPAGRLAVEARRRDEHRAVLHPLGPGSRVELHPVVPPLLRRVGREVDPARAGIEGLAPGGRLGLRGADPLAEADEGAAVDRRHRCLFQARGTDWPAWT
jgi:hypothetical protein